MDIIHTDLVPFARAILILHAVGCEPVVDQTFQYAGAFVDCDYLEGEAMTSGDMFPPLFNIV